MDLVKVQNNEISLIDSAVEKVKELITLEIQVETIKNQLKEELLKAMEDNNIKSFDHPLLSSIS